MINEKPCSFCGNNTFVELTTTANGNLMLNQLSVKSEPIYHVVCTRCGTVNRSYIKNPQKFVEKMNKGKWV